MNEMLQEISAYIVNNLYWIVPPMVAAAVVIIKKVNDRLKINRIIQITNSNHKIIRYIENIEDAYFPDYEQTPKGTISENIEDSKYNLLGMPAADSALILLVYMKGNRIAGHLSAEYNTRTNIIFLWYIVNIKPKDINKWIITKGNKDIQYEYDESVAIALVARLSAICNRIKKPWHQIVAEVDTRNAAEAAIKLREYQIYARKLKRERENRGIGLIDRDLPSVFKLNIDFHMPLHDDAKLTSAKKLEVPAWLLCAPQFSAKFRTEDNRFLMPKDQLTKILQSVSESYKKKGEAAYNAYVEAFFAAMLETAPENTTMEHERSRM